MAKGKFDVLMSLDGRWPAFVTLGSGKFFGESSLLDNAPRSAFVRAKGKHGLLYVLRKTDLKAILRESPGAVRFPEACCSFVFRAFSYDFVPPSLGWNRAGDACG